MPSTPATNPGLRVFSTLAVMGALQALKPGCEAACATALAIEFAPTSVLDQRIAAGEAADIAILTAASIEALATAGTLLADSRTDLVRSRIGIAVRAGAPHPDIGTVEAFLATLRDARSIAYSRSGASGIFFAALIERLGVAAMVNAKATIIPAGFTAEHAASGQVDLAVQQISELMMVPGVDIVGALPEAIGSATVFSAGILARTENPQASRALLAFLAGAQAAALFATTGLQPLNQENQG